MEEARDAPWSTVSPYLEYELSNKHFVFVDGIMNELASLVRDYFTDNIRVVKEMGLSYSHLGFSSQISIPRNADELYARILTLYEDRSTPLVLIGHSMGGAEVLYCILKHPELMIDGIVDRVILLNPAVGGTILADTIYETLAGRVVGGVLGEGLISLRTDVAQSNFRKIFHHFQKQLKKRAPPANDSEILETLSRKVFTVRTQNAPGRRLSIGLETALVFCKSNLDKLNETHGRPGARHDGLLDVQDQGLNPDFHFGTDLGVLDADHIELVVSGLASRGTRLQREAFTRALLQTVFGNDKPIPAPQFGQELQAVYTDAIY